MSIHKKLNQARILLQTQTLSKSGENTFAKYKYFELRDFLPAINLILDDIGLCGVVSFSSDLATLTLTDVDDGSHIIITSPMGSASLKGCHEVQNIGAVETYQRRYLWVSAFEIVEHDALEAMTGKEPPAPKQSHYFEQLNDIASMGMGALEEYHKANLKGIGYKAVWESENKRLKQVAQSADLVAA